MAAITVTIPDAQANRVLDAIAATYGWTSLSGLTKAQFAKQHLIRHIKDIVVAYEASAAAEAARLAAKTDAETIAVT